MQGFRRSTANGGRVSSRPPPRVAIQVLIRSGDDRKNRPKKWHSRQRRPPLRDAEIGSSQHSDASIRPALPGNPVNRVVAVAVFLNRRLEKALACIPSPDVLNNKRELTLEKDPVSGDERGSFPIRSTDQQRRKSAGRAGR